jgi:hypothetical protein
MNIDIRRMNARELCEYSISPDSGATERKFVNGLGFGNKYNNLTGSPNFKLNKLIALAEMVKDSAEFLKVDYETKNDLQQAMRHEFIESITNPIMENFARIVWNGSDLSDPPPGQPTKLQYTDKEDKELYLRPQIQTCIHSLTYHGIQDHEEFVLLGLPKIRGFVQKHSFHKNAYEISSPSRTPKRNYYPRSPPLCQTGTWQMLAKL